MEQQPIELLPASDKSASIINNALKSQSREASVQLRATSLSPQKRHSEHLAEGSPRKRLPGRIVDLGSGNGIEYSQPPTKQNDGRLKRPTRKAGPSGTRSFARLTRRNLLDIPPEPAETDVNAGTSTMSGAVSETREVQHVSRGQIIDPLASDEAPAEDDSVCSADVKEGTVDGTPAEPETPARGRGRPRKEVSIDGTPAEPETPARGRGRPRKEVSVDGTPTEPETPARGRGHPRKEVSENHVATPKKSNRPRGRPPNKSKGKLLADPKTPAPLDRPRKQGSSASHDVVGQINKSSSNTQSLRSLSSLIVQETPNVSAGTHMKATSGGSQSKLPNRRNEMGISDQPGNAIQSSPDDRASGGELGSADESEHTDESERRDVTSDAPANAEGIDDSMERSRREDEPWANAEYEDAQSEIRTGPELFNEEENWIKTLEAARKIRKLRVNSGRKPGTIRLQTQTFKTFIRRVKEAYICYQELASRTDFEDEAEQSLESRLKAGLKWLHSEVDALDILHAGNKQREMVRDIYAHAIPGMVSLLRYAFEARSPLYSATKETRTLKEIVRLLETTHTLCKKARTWPAQPNTELPIVGPTSKVIYPTIRGMLSAFQDELDDRIEANRRATVEDYVPQMHSQQEALLLKRREETERAKERWLERAAADAQRKISGQTPFRPSHPLSQQAPKQDQWNEEQDDALLMMLMNPAIAKQPRKMNRSTCIQKSHANYLTVEVRYTSVLNTPLLQNKLPEHIEKRAMYWKPSMQTSYTDENRPIPRWVSSLDYLTAVHSTI